MTRVGLGWRAPLGAAILANLDRIDVVEVMAEDFFHASAKERRALRTLRRFVPVVLHATSLGLASPEPVDRRLLDAVARVAGWLEPEYWSEHLAFVRGGGVEVGHLAAPPRNAATLAGLHRNYELAARVVGAEPLLENVASLVEPPLCAYSELEWLQLVPGRLLLDLHNLHANATNFGFAAREVVLALSRIGAVHLAGGKRIEGGRVLDDHLHRVPDAVYELLALTPACDTLLERDGRVPPVRGAAGRARPRSGNQT